MRNIRCLFFKNQLRFLPIILFCILYCKADLNNPTDPSSSPLGTLLSMLPQVSISDFNPKSGLAGTEVIINGSGFSSDPKENSVKFNDTIAKVISVAGNSVKVTVPEGGAVTGKISISVSGQTAVTQEKFIVPPVITGFSPSAGTTGAAITIAGTNFSENSTNNTVKFNGITAAVISSSNTEIQTIVPSNTSAGYISVDTNGFTSLSQTKFQTNISGNFYFSSNMNTGRYSHTATLLSSGKVLIAGGRNSTYSFSKSELYDPSTGIFIQLSNMVYERYSHTATLLQNGKVLITGGYGNPNAASSAELFDPESGTFSLTGNMTASRSYHTEIILANGKVLIIGGAYLIGSTEYYRNTSELYDPVLGTFTASGNMSSSRFVHTAVRLNNGKVLVTGGHNGTILLNSAELYDPAGGTFSATGSLNSAGTALHTSTLLENGLVLIAIGGTGSATIRSELFNASSFSVTGNMKYSVRMNHTADLLSSGKVLITGGGSSVTDLYPESELYNPTSGLFEISGNLNTSRLYHKSAKLSDGRILITGGKNIQGNTLQSTEIYTP